MAIDLDLTRMTLRLSALAYALPDRIARETGELGLREMTYSSGRSTQALSLIHI